MSGSLVVFSGIDGAGKSTQIDLLATALRQQGQRVRVVWTRGGYTPGMTWLKKMARRLLARKHMPVAGPSEARSAALSEPIVRRSWLTLAMLDLLWLYAAWIPAQRLFGTTVVCDRYLQDTALDFQLNFPDEAVHQWSLWRLLVRLSPTPEAAVMLLVPVDESLRRSAEKREPFPDSRQRLAQRMAHYQLTVRENPNWHVVDGLQPIPVVAEEILSIVSSANVPQEVLSLR